MRSILAVMAIESIAPEVRTVVEANNPAHVEHFRRAKADEVLVTSPLASRLLARSALYPGLSELVTDLVSGGKGRSCTASRSPRSYVGLSVDDFSAKLRGEHRATLLAVTRRGQVLDQPAADFRMQPGDDAVVVAESLGTLAPLRCTGLSSMARTVMTDDERIAALKAERDRALARAYELSAAYLRTLDERHVGPLTDARGHPRTTPLGAYREGRGRRGGRRRLAAALDPGIVASTGPRYLRLRDWRRAARRLRRRPADHRLEPEWRAARPLARRRPRPRRSPASGCSTCWACRPTRAWACPPERGWATPSAWRRPATGCYSAPAGTWRRPACTGRREIVVIIGDEAHATVLTALQYLGFGRDRVTRVADRRAGPDADGRAADRAGDAGPAIAAAGDRAGRQRQHRRLRPGGRDRGCRWRSTRTRGCTSTAPSACGPPSPRTCATWWPGSRRRTRGRPMPTSG